MTSLQHGNRFERNRNPWRSLTKQDHDSPILSEERQDRSHQAKTAAIHQESKIANKKKAPKDVVEPEAVSLRKHPLNNSHNKSTLGESNQKLQRPTFFQNWQGQRHRHKQQRPMHGLIGSSHRTSVDFLGAVTRNMTNAHSNEPTWDIKEPRETAKSAATHFKNQIYRWRKKKVARPGRPSNSTLRFRSKKKHEANTRN